MDFRLDTPAVRFGLFTVAVLALAVFAGAARRPLAHADDAMEVNRGLPEAAIVVGTKRLTVEIAATPDARRIGLMNRDTLPPDRGMLFVFPKARPVRFWMKNTRIPLSAAFCDATGRVLMIADMTPLSLSHWGPEKDAVTYVLEVNRGYFREAGVGEGDVLPLAAMVGNAGAS
ncbi:DUF192 domain-containing protein [bacterium]|nr:DUF192 domain-containing protein [bacterium]